MLHLTICASVLIAVTLASSPGSSYQTVRSESIDGEVNVRGQYSYVDPKGKTITTKYSAGKEGLKVEGDHIPKTEEASTGPAGQFNDAQLQHDQFEQAQYQELPSGPIPQPLPTNAQFNPAQQFPGFGVPQQLFAPTAQNAISQPAASQAQLNQFAQLQRQAAQDGLNAISQPAASQAQLIQFAQLQRQAAQDGLNYIGQPAASQAQLFQLAQLQRQAAQYGQQPGVQFGQFPQAPQVQFAQLPQGQQGAVQYAQAPAAPQFAPASQASQQFLGAPSQFPPTPQVADGNQLSLRQFQLPQFNQQQFQVPNEQGAPQFALPGGPLFGFQFPQPSGPAAPALRNQDPTQQLGAHQFPTVPSSPQLPAAQQYATPGGTQLLPQQPNIQVPHRFN